MSTTLKRGSRDGDQEHEACGRRPLPRGATDQEAGGRYRQNRRIRFWAYTVQAAALAVIGQGARRVNEVADQTQQYQSGASGLGALVDAGLVSRREDPDDRRAVFLQLTTKGTRVLGQIADSEISTTESILGQLDDDSAQVVVKVLSDYLDTADQVI